MSIKALKVNENTIMKKNMALIPMQEDEDGRSAGRHRAQR